MLAKRHSCHRQMGLLGFTLSVTGVLTKSETSGCSSVLVLKTHSHLDFCSVVEKSTLSILLFILPHLYNLQDRSEPTSEALKLPL